MAKKRRFNNQGSEESLLDNMRRSKDDVASYDLKSEQAVCNAQCEMIIIAFILLLGAYLSILYYYLRLLLQFLRMIAS